MEASKDTKNFKIEEFACPCCGLNKVQKQLMKDLQVLRDYFNKPIIVMSGTRCKKHNEEVGGVKNSRHLSGEAADITIRGVKTSEISQAVRVLKGQGKLKHISFIQEYPKRKFVHVDIRKTMITTFAKNYDKIE